MQIVQALVAAGADVTQEICADEDHHASLPLLHYAAFKDAPHCINALLTCGLNVDVSSLAGMFGAEWICWPAAPLSELPSARLLCCRTTAGSDLQPYTWQALMVKST